MSKVPSIDPGRADSCMAITEGNEPIVIPNLEGARTTPSTVAINKNGVYLVGEAAKRQAVANPENTISSIMRFVGRRYDDPETDHYRRLIPYKVMRASDGDASVEVHGKQYIAMILRKLKMDAEDTSRYDCTLLF